MILEFFKIYLDIFKLGDSIWNSKNTASFEIF